MIKLITIYLLNLEAGADSFSRKLIFKIYGKIASGNYKKNGVRNFFPILRRKLKDNLLFKLNSTTPKIKISEIQEFLESKGQIANKILKKRESFENSPFVEGANEPDKKMLNWIDDYKMFSKIETKIDLKEYGNNCLNSIGKIFWDLYSKKEFKEIEAKYIDHWEWLYKNKKLTGSKIFSFDILLKQAFLK